MSAFSCDEDTNGSPMQKASDGKNYRKIPRQETLMDVLAAGHQKKYQLLLFQLFFDRQTSSPLWQVGYLGH